MNKINELKNTLKDTLEDIKDSGAKIAAYGASAKGTTLLNYFCIDHNHLDFVVDRSLVKQGKITPGTQLRIYVPDKLIKENINYALLLSWNFADEILAQQTEYLARGGKFIIPLPKVNIIS